MNGGPVPIIFLFIRMAGMFSECSSDNSDLWEDVNLRLNEYKKLFTDQSQEINDIQRQVIDPANSTRIDLSLLRDGGPPKDGIPSIDHPQFDTGETTRFEMTNLLWLWRSTPMPGPIPMES